MRAVAVLLGVAACFKPVPPEGRPCSDPDDSCPTGLQCFGGLCLSQPLDGGDGIEAQPPDALPDGPPLPDADPNCHCVLDNLQCGVGAPTSCPLGCSEPPDHSGGHCIAMVPSNSVDAAFVTEVSLPIEIGGSGTTTTIDTDTGAISGGLTRMTGTGVNAGIGYHQTIAGGAQLGIFVFEALALDAGVTVKLVGSRAAVFLVATDAIIAGTIDGSGGCPTGVPSCGGPGAGTGGTAAGPATGCGAGGDGVSAAPGNQSDGGGGGGGGGLAGGAGGIGDATVAPGGAAGVACLASTLEPLVGGGGGGTGGGGSVTRLPGGGGGGALQISALGTLAVTGTINMAGEGGSGGPPAVTSNAGAGAGAGAGGGILLESPMLTLGASVILTCNGGGGGSAGSNTMPGEAGANGHPSTAAATGGNQVAGQSGRGGNGGAVSAAAVKGDDKPNGGGGGGAVGAIHLRASQAPQMAPGTFSPAFTSRTISTM